MIKSFEAKDESSSLLAAFICGPTIKAMSLAEGVELILELSNVDIAIVEGYKNENHPKIEVINEKENKHLFQNIKNVRAIISDVNFILSLGGKIYVPLDKYSLIISFCVVP